MTAIAIDDEPIALEVIKSHASKVPFVELKATFTNAFEAVAYLQKYKIDLLFLDIKMPDISGIEFFKSLSSPPMVVFTTAYSEHAVEGFEVDAVDYLLKPFSLSRFLKACTKANELLSLKNGNAKNEDYLFVKDGYEQVKVLYNDILYIEASGNYLNIFLTRNQKLMTRSTINDILLQLPESIFTRVHRSYIVANSKVSRYNKQSVFIDLVEIPIGNTYHFVAK
ncbi:LytR/AlgR family response regulator transcription factor [Niabella ginsengisoli]|uniref:LytTR family DNA-binding domain-containing protein n=1 Tax=Niabella ginsengisoli TaxID=522298 RepID=A0ABS9SP09_9BACT|nr:LytTR family DNA-binding domain-containing protein [Niabella ginsengisoli]MCH5600105.1 LytTR family DNA-binding domain-containing protein [Niabella ginsengisoli]